jgi:hypothetical protein
VIVGLFVNINTDLPASFKAAGHRSRYCTSADCNWSTTQLHIARTINI